MNKIKIIKSKEDFQYFNYDSFLNLTFSDLYVIKKEMSRMVNIYIGEVQNFGAEVFQEINVEENTEMLEISKIHLSIYRQKLHEVQFVFDKKLEL